MDRKRVELKKLDASRPEVCEHRYPYHANLGTFLVHRWASQGADRARINEVEAACDEIARALEINPDAHFGREKYQLQAMKWIVNPPQADGSQYLPNLLILGGIYGSTRARVADDIGPRRLQRQAGANREARVAGRHRRPAAPVGIGGRMVDRPSVKSKIGVTVGTG